MLVEKLSLDFSRQPFALMPFSAECNPFTPTDKPLFSAHANMLLCLLSVNFRFCLSFEHDEHDQF